jgi:glutaredoxin-like protein
MPLLDDRIKEEIKKIFDELKESVKLIVFTQNSLVTIPGKECATCRDNRTLIEEVATLSDKISIEVYDFTHDKEKVEQYKIEKIPATVIQGSKDHGIRMYGLPAGYEFSTLLNAIKIVSTINTELSEKTLEKLKTVSKPVHIQVFVTPTCPYCSTAAVTAHRMALASDQITADVISAQEFPLLSQRYNVYAVPKIVINESTAFEGAVPEDAFLEKVMNSIA